VIKAASERADVSLQAVRQDLNMARSELQGRHEANEQEVRNQLRVLADKTQRTHDETVRRLSDATHEFTTKAVSKLREDMEEGFKTAHRHTEGLVKQERERGVRDLVMSTDVCDTFTRRDVAASLTPRVSTLETSLSNIGDRIEHSARDVRESCREEVRTLGRELTDLRAASGSLAAGVFAALEVIGLLGDERLSSVRSGSKLPTPKSLKDRSVLLLPSYHFEDLLNWEKTGQALSTRILDRWRVRDYPDVPDVLSLIDRKADRTELTSLRHPAAEPGTPLASRIPMPLTTTPMKKASFLKPAFPLG